MNRTLSLVLFAALCLAGCTRSADPLDWKISAGDPEELEQWFARNLPLMPGELSDEVLISFNNLKADTTPGPMGSVGKREYRVCRRLDGHTVRDLLVEGHELANRALLARITNQSDAMVRLLGDAHTLDAGELKQREALINAHLALQGSLEQQLKLGEARVAALLARPGAPRPPAP